MKELVELTHVRELAADDKAGFDSLAKRLRERLAKVGSERLALENDEEKAEGEPAQEGSGV